MLGTRQKKTAELEVSMGTIKTPTGFFPEELVIVGIDVPDGDGVGDGPRQAEEGTIDERFVLNVMALGVIEPIIVRRRPDGRLEVIEGRRRVRAAREANTRLTARGEDPIRVPVVLRTGSDADMFAVAFSGNEFFRGNTVMTRAWLAREYLNKGRTPEDAAVRFAVDVATIKNWIALLETDSRVQSAVAGGEIGLTGALEIGRLPMDQQHEALCKATSSGNGRVGNAGKTVGGKVTTKAVKRAAAEVSGKRVIDPPPKKVLKQVLATASAVQALGDLSPVDVLRWVVGEIDAADRGTIASIMEAIR
jgi:ParB family chromosome partitioning protein